MNSVTIAFDRAHVATALPPLPGVYRFYDESGEIIYVGKAKNLKKRVTSYFLNLKNTNRKTQRLVSSIKNIQFTITENEYDALLLENSLIKEYQPRYNIALKDDKTYPFICIMKEPFPRVFTTRKINLRFAEYYGPYINVRMLGSTLELIKQLFHLRNCKLNLTEKNIQKKKFKVCLEYHVGNCKGPCEALQTEEDYMKDMEQIRNVLKGKISSVREYLKSRMYEHAERQEYEKAEAYKQRVEILEQFKLRSQVVNTSVGNIDVCTITSDTKYAYVNFLYVSEGAIIRAKTMAVKKKLDESNENVLTSALVMLREEFDSEHKEVLTNILPDFDFKGFKITMPERGERRRFIELSVKNALVYKQSLADVAAAHVPREERVLEALRNDLRLQDVPWRIECFDNSNFQGSNPVAAMVHFRNGKPFKKEYRHFNIKTVEGPNDFASMYEIVHRRYTRLKEENASLPDLIIIDGGKGQLGAACDALKALDLYGKIPVVGIAKRLEEIYYPEDEFPLHIDKKSESLKLIQRIRDEAHRFAVTFHRDKRSKDALKLELESIEGIGKDTINKLYKRFKTLSKIRKASYEELAETVGKKRAELIENARGEPNEALPSPKI